MASYSDMNGIWSGRYEYSGRGEAVKFTAWFDDQNGALSGTILEPNTFAASTAEDLQASISGTRTGLEIEFTKTYDEGSGAHTQQLIYSGSADKAFTLLRGTWTFPDGPMFNKGIFEMSRASVGIESARMRGLLASVDRR